MSNLTFGSRATITKKPREELPWLNLNSFAGIQTVSSTNWKDQIKLTFSESTKTWLNFWCKLPHKVSQSSCRLLLIYFVLKYQTVLSVFKRKENLLKWFYFCFLFQNKHLYRMLIALVNAKYCDNSVVPCVIMLCLDNKQSIWEWTNFNKLFHGIVPQ